jgi:hypothetical protein
MFCHKWFKNTKITKDRSKNKPFSDSELGNRSVRTGGGGRIFGTCGAATAFARFCFSAPRSLFGCPGLFLGLFSADLSLLLDAIFNPFPRPFGSSIPSSLEESMSDSESAYNELKVRITNGHEI